MTSQLNAFEVFAGKTRSIAWFSKCGEDPPRLPQPLRGGNDGLDHRMGSQGWFDTATWDSVRPACEFAVVTSNSAEEIARSRVVVRVVAICYLLLVLPAFYSAMLGGRF